MTDSATKYANQVLSGKITAGKWVRLACQRHLDDLERDDIYFDADAANHAIQFFSFLKHSKGEWAGQSFELELWQKFIVACLFGWKRPDGLRRFRIGYIEVSRKNGKSTILSGLMLYLFFADGEPGAECYSAATKRDQAIITHSEATRMVKASPALKKRIGIFKNNLHVSNTASKFEPLGADADSMDGLNIHGAGIDELHAHKKRDLWDVLETATGSRRQPLQIAITTAGVDQAGICYEQHQYVKQVLAGTVQDGTYFGIIYAIDKEEKQGDEVIAPGDDWRDEACWVKTNPNLGVSVKLDDLQRKANKAKEIPAAQNNFLRKHMDIWTQQFERWIDLGVWDENYTRPIDEAALAGRTCVGGIDLSAVSDLTCCVWAFPDAEDPELVDLLLRCWCPEARIYESKNRYRDQYQAWARQGFLTTTPGDAIDYDFVRARIVDDANRFKINSIAVDRLFQGYEFSQKLNAELGGTEKAPVIVACGMGYLSMAGPAQELEARMLKRKLNHGGNPILRWMADNVSVSMDPAGNKKPNKATSQGKIDGIVSILLCLDRLLRLKPKPKLIMPAVV